MEHELESIMIEYLKEGMRPSELLEIYMQAVREYHRRQDLKEKLEVESARH